MTVTRFASTFALVLALSACSSSSSTPAGADGDGGGTSSGSGGSSGGTSSGGSSSGGASSGGSSSGGSSSGGSSSGGSSSGGSGSGGTDAGGTPTDAGQVPANDAKLVLNIPSSFTGTTRELDVVVTPTVPMAGPPAGILYQLKNPVVTAGQALTIHGDATGIKGSYYVVVVLYMQGGGQFSPTPGIDYTVQTTATVSFTGSAIDLGSLTLKLAGDGGA